jgi:hypothetical protein
MMMNWKGPNFKALSRHSPGGIDENHDKLQIRIAGRWGRGSNPGPPEYEVGVSTTRQLLSVPGTLCRVVSL